MRGVKLSVPTEKLDATLELAFRLGIGSATVYDTEHVSSDGKRVKKAAVEIETSTPVGKLFSEAFIAAPFFDQQDCFLSTRQRRSIISSQDISDITWPWVEPGVDILQELWQFSHLTYSLVLRTCVAGGLIAYGLINQQFLFIISGILFLPLLPIILAVGFGSWLRQWHLVRTAATTFAACIALLLFASVITALVSQGPVKYNEFPSLAVSAVVAAGVGIAAALASSDDAGRRELIGLAATAQIAIIPCWIGATLILGQPEMWADGSITRRLSGFFLNLLIIIVASTSAYFISGAFNPALKKLRS